MQNLYFNSEDKSISFHLNIHWRPMHVAFILQYAVDYERFGLFVVNFHQKKNYIDYKDGEFIGCSYHMIAIATDTMN